MLPLLGERIVFGGYGLGQAAGSLVVNEIVTVVGRDIEGNAIQVKRPSDGYKEWLHISEVIHKKNRRGEKMKLARKTKAQTQTAPSKAAKKAPAILEFDAGDGVKVFHTKGIQGLITKDTPDLAILDSAESLLANIQETYYLFGGVLSHIYRMGTYRALGFEGKKGFETYCEERLNFRYRKAMHYINIYEGFSALGIDETRLSKVGWTKAKELLAFANKENARELIELAEKSTHVELVETLNRDYSELKTSVPRGNKPKRRFTFMLEANQAAVATKALDTAAERGEIVDSLNDAFVALCMEYNTLTDNAGAASLANLKKFVKERYGMVIVKPKGGEAKQAEEPKAENKASKNKARKVTLRK